MTAGGGQFLADTQRKVIRADHNNERQRPHES
jgi:hypothetical protein